MSFHVYIARPGFKDTPISRDEWLSVVRSQSKLKITETPNRRGPALVTVSLCADKLQTLALDPYGLVHTQNPSKELVAVMFDLSAPFGAGVYSEKLKRYASLEDWEEHTRSYRSQHQRARTQARNALRKKQLMGLAVIVAAAVAGWLLHA